ncbi:hypothetical protein [Thermaerobacter subterraneus]|uniref:Uncharacterized protein n=1 Tax=Thermaerobacter subterraneus DSM 13965 TaxID=867903 RepID=K6P2T3_9FIRM|nr:hypothetical protein [Thermaerobacter subterraneus]EKP95380.1 hypothetical protein ThesuDRAFT_01131 [Thermaerobacter subterraneus DSM 13965]
MHEHLTHAVGTGHGSPWPWLVLVLLGAYHGVNPAMGWLFAVALGMQARSGRRVVWALLPIGLGHALSVGLVLALLWGARAVLPAVPLRYGVAALLVGYGLFHLFRSRHAGGRVGMQVGFAGLVLWSFLMATAHGAGLMLAPLVWWAGPGPGGAIPAAPDAAAPAAAPAAGPAGATTARPAAAATVGVEHGTHLAGADGSAFVAAAGGTAAAGSGLGAGPGAAAGFALGSGLGSWAGVLLAAAVHAASMLVVAGAVALLVYYRFGLFFLRRAWVNVDLVWAVAMVASGLAVALVG